MTQENLLTEAARYRKHLQHCIMQAAGMNHKITDARESLKRVEDMIVNEIWTNEKFKNDKARNEQKHLARINDERFISGQEVIRQLELQKADLHGMILVTQNELTITTLMYQAALLGKDGGTFGAGGFGMTEVVEMTPQADTVEVPEVKLRLASQFIDEGSTGLSDAAKATLLNDYVPTLPEPAKTSLRDQLAASMSPEKLAELTADQPEPVPVVKTQAQIEREEQDKAPYLKPTSDKKTEKVGNVRI